MGASLRYVSTRQSGDTGTRSFEDILLEGIAPDGGLYVPVEIPNLSHDEIRRWRGADYASVAAAVLERFAGGTLTRSELDALTQSAYRGFDHPAVAPLKQIGRDEWLLELFHGPTLAFKDYALQVLGRLFDKVLARRRERITIIGATSGDTGSAAIEACRDRDMLDVFILYPDGRTSEVQRRQMTTVASENVHTLAIDGSFDDCQDLVKAMFADAPFRSRLGLASVNSINWARITAQIAYYFVAATALGAPDRPVSFAVPTGNFGNVYAGHVARAMGLPVRSLVIGTNRNDILWRFIASGDMSLRPVEPSLSPSMDIQVSSNFERLYHEVLGRDGAATAAAMTAFRRDGRLPANEKAWQRARLLFEAHRLDDEGIEATIADVFHETGEIIDPHSAVAVAAMRAQPGEAGVPRVALACAHPAKFPEAVERITGYRPVLPPHLEDLMERQETINRLPNDLDAVRRFVASRARRGAAQ